MDATDLKLSRKMQKIIRRVQQLVDKEMGEPMGVAVVIFPFTRPGEESRQAHYQYVSNVPREHMRNALRVVVAKWDAGVPDPPPHLQQ